MDICTREMKTCPQKNLFREFNNIFLHNGPKLEQTQCPSQENKQIAAYPYNDTLLSNNNKKE